MALAETFILRLFVYGLIGLAPDGSDAVILVPSDKDHRSFVGFAAGCQDASGKPIKCPMVKFGGESEFRGYKLEGHKIELGNLSEGTASSSPIEHTPSKGVPTSQKDASSLSWVPSMASILKVKEDGRVKDDCLRDPGECMPPLKGWMKLTKGKFETCQLVRHWKFEGIFSYQFKHPATEDVLWEQALADIIRLDVKQEGASVPLKLTNFGETEVLSVVLTPVACPDRPGDKCVDVFIGNMAAKNKANGHTKAEHFHRFYEYLAANDDMDKKVEKPKVEKNHGTSAEDSVQPLCRNVPPSFAFFPWLGWKDRKRSGSRELSVELLSPESRPICPMVIYSQ